MSQTGSVPFIWALDRVGSDPNRPLFASSAFGSRVRCNWANPTPPGHPDGPDLPAGVDLGFFTHGPGPSCQFLDLVAMRTCMLANWTFCMPIFFPQNSKKNPYAFLTCFWLISGIFICSELIGIICANFMLDSYFVRFLVILLEEFLIRMYHVNVDVGCLILSLSFPLIWCWFI